MKRISHSFNSTFQKYSLRASRILHMLAFIFQCIFLSSQMVHIHSDSARTLEILFLVFYCTLRRPSFVVKASSMQPFVFRYNLWHLLISAIWREAEQYYVNTASIIYSLCRWVEVYIYSQLLSVYSSETYDLQISKRSPNKPMTVMTSICELASELWTDIM